MPRRELQFAPGVYYHIYNRGAGRQSICRTDEDYVRLLRLLKSVAEVCRVSIVAYCLLPNHYHWLVRQGGAAPAGLVPRRVFGSYTRTFNHIHGRSGTLFEDRFQAKLVDTTEYLLYLCRYIHANPVRHGVAGTPELWPYSNYLEWLGERGGTLVDRAFVETYAPDAAQYRRSVLDYLTGQLTFPEPLRQFLAALEE